ncbi:hypothetical protein MTsN2n6_27000 [Vibrio fortis]
MKKHPPKSIASLNQPISNDSWEFRKKNIRLFSYINQFVVPYHSQI